MPSVFVILLLSAAFSTIASAVPVHIYGRDDFNLLIPAKNKKTKGSMLDAAIDITDPFTIQDLNISITVTHTNIFDLQLILESPAGTRICLNAYDFKKDFFKGKGYLRTVFDDEAPTPIEKGNAPFSGRFKPKAYSPDNLLSAFDGQSLAGTWKLKVTDMWEWDSGTLRSFKMIVTVPEPATALFLALGAGLISLIKSRKNR